MRFESCVIAKRIRILLSDPQDNTRGDDATVACSEPALPPIHKESVGCMPPASMVPFLLEEHDLISLCIMNVEQERSEDHSHVLQLETQLKFTLFFLTCLYMILQQSIVLFISDIYCIYFLHC